MHYLCIFPPVFSVKTSATSTPHSPFPIHYSLLGESRCRLYLIQLHRVPLTMCADQQIQLITVHPVGAQLHDPVSHILSGRAHIPDMGIAGVFKIG